MTMCRIFSILDAINSSYDDSFAVETHSDEPKQKIPKQELGKILKNVSVYHFIITI